MCCWYDHELIQISAALAQVCASHASHALWNGVDTYLLLSSAHSHWGIRNGISSARHCIVFTAGNEFGQRIERRAHSGPASAGPRTWIQVCICPSVVNVNELKNFLQERTGSGPAAGRFAGEFVAGINRIQYNQGNDINALAGWKHSDMILWGGSHSNVVGCACSGIPLQDISHLQEYLRYTQHRLCTCAHVLMCAP